MPAPHAHADWDGHRTYTHLVASFFVNCELTPSPAPFHVPSQTQRVLGEHEGLV